MPANRTTLPTRRTGETIYERISMLVVKNVPFPCQNRYTWLNNVFLGFLVGATTTFRLIVTIYFFEFLAQRLAIYLQNLGRLCFVTS